MRRFVEELLVATQVRNADELSVQQQVEVLVDMATDPNVLGRQWWGGALWI